MSQEEGRGAQGADRLGGWVVKVRRRHGNKLRCQGAADGRHDAPLLQYSTEIADHQRVFSRNLKVLEQGSLIKDEGCGAWG